MTDWAVRIRAAEPADYPSVCAVIDEVDALHRHALPHIFRSAGGPVRERADFLRWIADEGSGLFVAEAAGEVIGFGHVWIREAPQLPIFVPRRYAVVDSLAVNAGWRARGVGRTLMAQAEVWAVAKGANALELHVWEFNRDAIAFYERLGYGATSRRMSKPLTPAETAG